MSQSQRRGEARQPQTANSATPMDQLLILVGRIAAAHIELFTAYVHIGSHTTVSPAADRHQTPSIDPLPARAIVSAELIRARAYQRYEQRGRQPGDALDDWHRAETELLAGHGGTLS